MEPEKYKEKKEDGKDNDNFREETKLSVKKVILWILTTLFVLISVWYLFYFMADFFNKGSGGGFTTPQVPLD